MRGHLEKRYNGSWTIIIEMGNDPKTGKRRRIGRNFKGNKREAEKEMVRLMHELETGAFVEPARLTVENWMRQWLEQAKLRLAAKTHYRYVQLVESYIIPNLGQVELTNLKPLHIQRMYAQLLEGGRRDGRPGGLSSTTVRHIHALLHSALKVAVKLQVMRHNPADAVDAPKMSHPEPQVFTEEQVARMLEAARETPHYVPLLLAVTTGMRRGEIYGLRWQDVDLDEGVITVRQTVAYTPKDGIFFKEPKTSSSRRQIALPRMAVDALKTYRLEQMKRKLQLGPQYTDLDLVFDRGDGQPRHPDTLSSWLPEFLERIGLPRLTVHQLRHTHASLLLRLGVNPKIVQERLGHSSIDVTMDIYSHLMPGMQEQAASKLDAVIRSTK